MPQDNVKEQLITATMKLLTGSNNPSKITARQIASEANVNLAMINYYFNSKDALINEAVGKLMEDQAKELKSIREKDIPGKQKLEEFLVALSDSMIRYGDITKPTIPYLLLEGEIETPYYILPMIRECCSEWRSEMECRLIAYQIIATLQLIFYRSEDFQKYLGIDSYDKGQREQAVKSLLDICLGKSEVERDER